MIEAQFLSFFIVLLVAVFFSALFSRLHLPWAVSLIVGGVIIGPHAFDLFTPNDTMFFLGEIGMVFLMFMAGLEMRFETFKKEGKSLSLIALINGALPFLVGLFIALYLGFTPTTALLVGIIFISSSVAVVVPSLSANNMLSTKLGNAIVGSTMLQDIASLILLSVFFQATTAITSLPLVLFYVLLIGFLVLLRKIIPAIELFFAHHDSLGQEFRSVMVILLGTVVMFELLGLHPIIAGFFAGLVLSDTLRHKVLKEKLRTISYGLFIPIFFIVIGAQTNLSAFSSAESAITIVLFIVLGSLLSKLASGWLAAKMSGFTQRESSLVAITSVPQLSTTLAVAFSASALNIISDELMTALVILSITTTLLAPLLTNWLLDHPREKTVS